MRIWATTLQHQPARGHDLGAGEEGVGERGSPGQLRGVQDFDFRVQGIVKGKLKLLFSMQVSAAAFQMSLPACSTGAAPLVHCFRNSRLAGEQPASCAWGGPWPATPFTCIVNGRLWGEMTADDLQPGRLRCLRGYGSRAG